jgi:hypothetical protein
MRTYIIGNDGITLCREPPAVVDEGEIVVASKQQLHAAALSGKLLLALWNALSGVQKRRKVGDRDSLIDELWAAIELLPEPEPPSNAKQPSKQHEVIGDAVSARGCHGRRGSECNGLAAPHRARRVLGNAEKRSSG